MEVPVAATAIGGHGAAEVIKTCGGCLSRISKAKILGLEVFTEVGRKYPDKPLDIGEAIESIRADLEMGARSVTIEAAETAILKETNPQVLIDIAEAIGLNKIVFECSPPYPWTDAAVWR